MFTALLYRVDLSWLPGLVLALLLAVCLAGVVLLTAAYAPIILAAAGAMLGKAAMAVAGVVGYAMAFKP